MSSLCPNCGKPGPHFAPPSMGEEGFYVCDPGVTTASTPQAEPLTFEQLRELVRKADELQAQADAILRPLVPAEIGGMDTLLSGLRRGLREQQDAEKRQLVSKYAPRPANATELRAMIDGHERQRDGLQRAIDRLWELFRSRPK